MADSEWRGRWWLPDKTDDVMPGTLIQREQDGEVLLKLIGGFSNVVLNPVSRSDSAISYEPEFVDEFPIILGESAGELFTLLRCIPLHSGRGLQDIRVMRALRGIHLTEPDQEVFDSVEIQIEYLLGWTRTTTLKGAVELANGNWAGKQSATTTPVDDLTVTHGGSDYRLSIVFNQFQIKNRPRANERSLANLEWAELAVKAPQRTTFREFDGIAKTIMDLMTLVAHAPAGVIEETLWFTAPDTSATLENRTSQAVQVMGRQIHQPKPGPSETGDAEYLFTLDDIPFADVLPRWLDLQVRTWLGCSTLFGLRYIREGYITARLLTVATAAEAIHRGLFPNATRMTFRERLLALAAIPDQEAIETLISDVPKWATYIKERRNGIAHGDRDRIGSEEAGIVFDALEVTIALLGLVLLSELGLSPDVQRRAASSQYLNLIVARFNKGLA
jgi:hypothetical protein